MLACFPFSVYHLEQIWQPQINRKTHDPLADDREFTVNWTSNLAFTAMMLCKVDIVNLRAWRNSTNVLLISGASQQGLQSWSDNLQWRLSCKQFVTSRKHDRPSERKGLQFSHQWTETILPSLSTQKVKTCFMIVFAFCTDCTLNT